MSKRLNRDARFKPLRGVTVLLDKKGTLTERDVYWSTAQDSGKRKRLYAKVGNSFIQLRSNAVAPNILGTSARGTYWRDLTEHPRIDHNTAQVLARPDDDDDDDDDSRERPALT